jgi:hypothetical protein
MDVSITELMSFRRCRRAWNLTSPNRLSLRKIGSPSAALQVGTGVHLALAAHAQGQDWLFALESWLNDELLDYRTKYRAVVGMYPSDAETQALLDSFNLTKALIERYFENYGETQPLVEYRYVAVEQTFRVPIPDTDGFLIGTFDGIARDGNDRLFLVEHKTFEKTPSDADLHRNEQFMCAYPWAAQALLGEPVTGVLYDGIRRALPGKTESKVPYWKREKLFPSPRQVATFASYLPVIYREMAESPVIYPNFEWTCFLCHVQDLCKAIQYGEDVEWLIKQGYTKGGGSQSFKQRHGQEVAVDAAAFA